MYATLSFCPTKWSCVGKCANLKKIVVFFVLTVYFTLFMYIFTLSPAHNFSILIAGFITILCLVSTCNAILWICWLALSLTVHSDKEPSFHSNILFNQMAYGITFFAYAQHIVIQLLYLWKCFTDAISTLS